MTVPRSVVRAELRAIRFGGHHDLREVSHLVSSFDESTTVRGLNHLAFAAFAALEESHLPACARPFVTRLIASAHGRVAPAVEPTITIGFEGAGECDVDFDDHDILEDNSAVDDPQAHSSTATPISPSRTLRSTASTRAGSSVAESSVIATRSMIRSPSRDMSAAMTGPRSCASACAREARISRSPCIRSRTSGTNR
jgi:hypothetical protein